MAHEEELHPAARIAPGLPALRRDRAPVEGPEWERARTWGWVMESGELTGTGWAHIRELPRGILIDRRSEMGDPHVHAHSAPIPRELAESGRNP